MNRPKKQASFRKPAKSAPPQKRAGASAGHGTKSFDVREPMELLPFLIERYARLSRNSVKSLLTRKQVAVDGRIVSIHNHPLEPGQVVTVGEREPETAPLAGMSILHEDEDIIVIHKDAGLLSIATDKEDQLTAYRQLTAYVRRTDPRQRIFIVHRLDRDTSGVMMFARSEQIQQQLQNEWQEAVVERSYVALVEGRVRRAAGRIESWLKESKTLRMYASERQGDGQHAITHYKVMETSRTHSLLEVTLETGRKNQIRVHMEEIGHPVVGDKKYGSTSNIIGRLGLHARILVFRHPRSGELLRFETPIPKAFLTPFRSQS
ncbi:RluA family pseudouridine synthase [Paenibacillus daejeonensis]|uniref:RluA family pseudouridine synthase n=1 Tax=Paenibacillus daejeonensis TaxID=135193 RepID=UPI00037B8CE7